MLRILPKIIAKEEAIRIAKNEAISRGWPWEEPIHASRGLRDWFVYSNAGSIGQNVNVTVGGKDGKVKSSGFASR